MSRSPEVEAAMRNTESGMYCTDDADALAAEIERLEVALAKADEAARAAMYAVDERAFLAESAEKSEKRAEAAEARVAELEAQLLDLTPTIKLALDTADLREQNARLREVLEPTLCRAYTAGWQRGHNATVDREFFYVHHLDEPTYFLEDVRGIMKDSLPELKAALADGKARNEHAD